MTTPDDLAARVRAAVEARLALAQAATRPPLGEGAWTIAAEGNEFALIDGVGWTVASGYMAPDVQDYVAANSPDVVIRHCLADLRRLERHRPDGGGDCKACAVMCINWQHNEEWPCDEFLLVADAYQINVTGEEQR